MTSVNPPAKGLGSNSNYALADVSGSSCSPLLGLTATITINADLVCASATGPTIGFNFQLNTYSNQSNSAWQQYIFGVIGDTVHGKINNFKSNGENQKLVEIINESYPLPLQTSIPNLTLPAGYVIVIALSNDSLGNVNGVTWTLSNGNTLLGSMTQLLLEIPNVTQAELAPIVALELVLVGPADGNTAKFSSGTGTFDINVSANQALTVLSSLPSCVAHTNGTAEMSNCVYAPLAAGPANSTGQAFSIPSGGP